MRMIADGKEAVLNHLESQLAGMPGHPGRYMLAEDDNGQLVICGMRLPLHRGVVRMKLHHLRELFVLVPIASY